MTTYKIKRFYFEHGPEVIAEGLTLEEAQEHCNDDEASSKTCSTTEGLERTRTKGPWFDGYERES